MYILLLELFFYFCILFRKKSKKLFGRSGRDAVGGIGFSSFDVVNDLSIL